MIERTKVDTEPASQRDSTRERDVDAHERELQARFLYLTVAELAERWRVSQDTVRSIPFERLPWIQVGRGVKNVHRRYDPRAVEEFERRGRGK